jgi:hypothetical protein
MYSFTFVNFDELILLLLVLSINFKEWVVFPAAETRDIVSKVTTTNFHVNFPTRVWNRWHNNSQLSSRIACFSFSFQLCNKSRMFASD